MEKFENLTNNELAILLDETHNLHEKLKTTGGTKVEIALTEFICELFDSEIKTRNKKLIETIFRR